MKFLAVTACPSGVAHTYMAAEAIQQACEKAGVPMASAEVTMIPQNYVDLTSDNDVKLMNRILDMLDDDDDVQEVYHNWNQPEEEDE